MKGSIVLTNRSGVPGMLRKLRVRYPGAVSYVMSRGNHRERSLLRMGTRTWAKRARVPLKAGSQGPVNSLVLLVQALVCRTRHDRLKGGTTNRARFMRHFKSH